MIKENGMRVALYGELDPHFGSIKQSIVDLPKVTSQLKVACLLYDRVIINTNAFNEHCLTLPALERLMPFVKSGILWTTGNLEGESPLSFISRRIDKYNFEKNSRGNCQQVKLTIERFSKIAPDNFEVYRNPNIQSLGATQNLLLNLETYFHTNNCFSTIHKRLEEKIAEMNVDNRFSKQELFAYMIQNQDQFDSEHLKKILLLIQGEYMNQGARHKSKNHIEIFSGQMAQSISSIANLMQTDSINISKLSLASAKSLFFSKTNSFETLLNISTERLFAISQSLEWLKIKELIWSGNWHTKSNLNYAFKFVEDKLAFLSEEQTNDCKVGTTFFEPWSVYAMSSLGVAGQYAKKNNKKELVLNQSTRVLKNNLLGSQVLLSQQEINYLLVVAACPQGKRSRLFAIQYKLESEIFLAKNNNRWMSYIAKKYDNEDLFIALVDRVDKAIKSLKLKLKEVEINFDKINNNWVLKSKCGKFVYDLTVNNIFNDEYRKVLKPDEVKVFNNPVYIEIYKTLLGNYPRFVSNQTICNSLSYPLTHIQLSKKIYKMNQKLTQHQPVLKIISDKQGQYRLL